MIGRSALIVAAAVAMPPDMAMPETQGSLVATRSIPARALIGAEDVRFVAPAVPGALTEPTLAIGREARVTLHAGRPVHPGDLAEPALVERNAAVRLIFRNGTLAISTEGRALDRGAAGARVRAMNLASRNIVHGRVTETGAVEVTR